MRPGLVQQSVVEPNCEGDKEKKKKRRSNRRSKQSTPPPPTSVNGLHGEAPECLGDGRTCNHVTASLSSSSTKQHVLDMRPPMDHGWDMRPPNEHALDLCPPIEHELTRASDVGFSSMPTMRICEQVNPMEEQNIPNQHVSDFGHRVMSQSCPEPVFYRGSPGTSKNNYMFPSPHIEGSQKKYFDPHWSMEAVNEALKKGDAFKVLFRVNAHNRLEAYCKIDGVPTDVLISGIAAQNRAVEGDIVVLKVDPSSLWTRMKGSTGVSNNPAPVEDCNILLEDGEIASDNSKGKSKVDADYECDHYRSCPYPEKGSCYGEGTFVGETVHLEPSGPASCNLVHPAASDSLHVGSFNGQSEVVKAVGRICSSISTFPSKRPTGRIVSIIKRSPRRDAIVGYLNVKNWLSYHEFCRKETKNRSSLTLSDSEYIHLTPTDPKLPKMMVFVKGLPDCIKKRLEKGDSTVEMELVAARIEEWDEESSVPLAHVLHIFGRGSEVEAQINAILFENAIRSSEFSPELLSSIPHIPWEVPREEVKSRRDLRNLCIFTIDPSTAIELDDALSIEKLSNGNFRVGVHIADVSYFILPDTAIDIEAQVRSTSVYLSQYKLPMLPPMFSENLCSLNPGVDRLAFSIFMDINYAGDVVDHWIGRSVIQSCCKLSYKQAQDIIDEISNVDSSNITENGNPQLYGHFKWPDVVRSVKSLHEISKILKEKRFSDGALRLESSKVVYLFDDHGIPYDSMLCGQKESNFLVEEFMLLANRTAAEIISRAFPDSALLRRHPEPNMRKLREFEAFCCKHGLELDTSSSGRFNQSLEQIREKLKDDTVLFDILISYASRPMQVATYFCSGDQKNGENDWGHYALAVPHYTHFTSPLRRYPDIIVHRTLAAAIEAEELYLKYRGSLPKVSRGEKVARRCFTCIHFDRDAAESLEGKKALSAAAVKHGVPCSESLADVAAYCNERKQASGHVKDACDKLYMWVLLKKKKILFSEARVLGLGPRFMSIYIQKLAIERRIYYDEVEGLTVEWLETTSTLVLSLANKRSSRRGGPGKWRALEDIAFVVSPCDVKIERGVIGGSSSEQVGDTGVAAQASEPICKSVISNTEVDPGVFPLTVHLLSTIPVVLHAVGGDDGPLDIGARLYLSSYLR
ncbi:DIS3-like exonuclease 2 [Quercus lobata]|uniref:DIS3-like exonuclease 2 n=1 Tax=Quercus lobata TaxID=97700 RepID=A0A7N2MKR4_QUELO|nr:DIS3-like exonuclease 2 [Quercus lobata]